MRARTIGAAFAVAAAVAPRGAAAVTAKQLLAQAAKQIDDADFEGALATLQLAEAHKNADPAIKVEVLHRLGEVNVLLDRPDAAQDAFARLFELAPGYTAPAEDPPSVREAFARAQKTYAASHTPIQVALAGAPPSGFMPGKDVPVSAAIAGMREPLEAKVYVRAAPGAPYEAKPLAHDAGDTYTSALPASLFNAPGDSAEFYVAVLDARGEIAASAGTADKPFKAVARAATPPAPIYTRWWFWAGAGGLVVAAAAVGYVAFSRPSTGTIAVAVKVQ